MKKMMPDCFCRTITTVCHGVLVSLLLMLPGSFVLHAQIELIKDINTSQDAYYNEFGELTDVDGTLYFIVDGDELWKSDGTPAGTVPVKSFFAMAHLTDVSGTLFFTADDGVSGWELWKSDGTDTGTVRVKDLKPGINSSAPHELTAVNGILFFIADNGLTGNEVWKSDGTAAGTRLTKDIKAGPLSGHPSGLTEVNGRLFFSATTGTAGYELWISDGTNSGTKVVRDIYAGGSGSFPKNLTNVNGTLFFQATEGIAGRELWKSDGTKGGTVRVKDIRAGAAHSNPHRLTAVNGTVFFEAHDGIHGSELWKSDGTEAGTVLVKDISPGPSAHGPIGSRHLDDLTNVNGVLYFVANHSRDHDLWRSDGTDAGTYPLTTGSDLDFLFLNPQITEHDGQVYFFAHHYTHETGQEFIQLWRTDGTPGGTVVIEEAFNFFRLDAVVSLKASGDKLFATGGGQLDITGNKLYSVSPLGAVMIKDVIMSTLGSRPEEITVVNSTLFFKTTQGGLEASLWRSDGTDAGTAKAKDFILMEELENAGGQVFFSARESLATDYELWTSDGTAGGTRIVRDMDPLSGSNPEHLTNVNGSLFFTASHPSFGAELWRSDGTEAGTVMIRDIYRGAISSSPEHFTPMNGLLYFAASTGGGPKLWKSDGTTSGTVEVKPAGPGGPHALTPVGSTLFFVANDGVHGAEVWKSDGTASGTTLVKDMVAGAGSPDLLANFRGLNNTLFFTAIQGGNNALWTSDGTSAGTTLLMDFYPGNEIIQVLEAVGNEMFMLVATGYSATVAELWKSNGTVSGTVKLKDMAVGPSLISSPYKAIDGVLYFYADNSRALWRTDGTACGTFPLEYTAPFSYMDNFVDFNGTLVFAAMDFGTTHDGFWGTELFKYVPEPFAPCATIAAAARTSEQSTFETDATEDADIRVSQYPNPFSSNFSLRISGKEQGVCLVQFISANGVSVEVARELKFNTDYTVGSQWGSGLYILKAVVDGRLVTRKLVKTR